MSKFSSFNSRFYDNSFRRWQEYLRDYLGIKLDQSCIDERAFEGEMRFSALDNIRFTRASESGLITSATKSTFSNSDQAETVFLRLQISGKITSIIGNREVVQNPGELMILGRGPSTHVSASGSQFIIIEMPEDLLKDVFGKRENFEFLKIDNSNPTSNIAGSFINNLENSVKTLDQNELKRMARICSDLITDSVFSYFRQTKSNSPSSSLVVFRAKAYIDDNLGNQSLDPSQVALTLGVSLRQLQIFFRENGESISEWIWMRRVEAVAKRLEDPKFAHMQVGVLAYSFGFTNQAHFTRRFKKHYDINPLEYKDMKLLGER